MSELPYKPSWIDRLTAWIDRLPIRQWLAYLVVAAPWVAVFVGIQASQGTYKGSGFFAPHLFVAIQPFFGIAGIHYLDRIASGAFQKFRFAMANDHAEVDSAYFRLTTLPARQANIAGLLGLLSVAVQLSLSGDPGSSMNMASTPISLAVFYVNIVVAWLGYGTFFYHAYHQLRVIDWLYTSKAIIDPFYPQPLYALSEITSRTAILGFVVLYGWFAVATGSLESLPTNPVFYLVSVSLLVFSLLIFVWPVWGAHRLLVDAKDQALKSNASTYKAALGELRGAVSSRELDEIEVWHKAIAAADLERRHIDRLATWPWSPGTLRSFLLALLIPIIVWIIQYGLQQLME